MFFSIVEPLPEQLPRNLVPPSARKPLIVSVVPDTKTVIRGEQDRKIFILSTSIYQFQFKFINFILSLSIYQFYFIFITLYTMSIFILILKMTETSKTSKYI